MPVEKLVYCIAPEEVQDRKGLGLSRRQIHQMTHAQLEGVLANGHLDHEDVSLVKEEDCKKCSGKDDCGSFKQGGTVYRYS
jgi:hypothetical protein